MAGIDDLISTFIGQTQQGLNAPPAPWQQELLETVNPEKVRRQNIARALAQASTAMATTPGNFLAGVSSAAATGADAYLTAKDQAEDQRMKVQQLVQMAQQKDQDRRLSLLMDAIGVQRNQIQDKRQAESHTVGLERDKAYTDYYKRRGVDEEGGSILNANQRRVAKQSILSGLDRTEKALRNPQGNQPWLDEDQIQQRLAEEQDRLERIYGVRLMDEEPSNAVQNPSPQVVQPRKTDQVVQKGGATGKKPAPAEILRQAQDAIAKGADPAAVHQRLIDNGYDASGI
jgi:hypothetical protein